MTVALSRLAAIAVVDLPFALPASALPTQCTDTARLSRTFAPPGARPAAAVQRSGFEVTRDDFFAMYPYGAELHIGTADGDAVRQLDVGLTADPGAFAWAVPAIDLEVTVWTVTDPADTPFAHLAPDATHVLVTSSDPEFDGTLYDYYAAEAGQLVFRAFIGVPADGSPNEEELLTQPIFPFPITTDLYFTDTGYTYFEDDDDIEPTQPLFVAQAIGFHRYGTLTGPEGRTFEGGMVYADVEYYDVETEELFTWDSYYSFFAEDGSLFQFRIAENPGPGDTPIEGEVWIDEIEFTRVVLPSVSLVERPSGRAPWTVFPNPVSEVVRFSEPLTATVFDVRGRAVREARNASEVDLRGLAPGTYVVRSEAGHSRPLTVRR